ncbi:alpha/beta hydrolase [Phormidesmis sp. 146-33]
MQLELIARSPEGNKSGQSVLFIHGAYHGAWCWEEHFLDYFAQLGYFAYALNLRGHGNSDSSSQKVSFSEYLEDIDRTIQKIEKPTILVGHSLGGMLVQKYIEKNSVPAAVIMSTSTPSGLRAVGLRFLRLYPAKTIQMLLTSNPDVLWHSSQVIQSFFLPNKLTEEARNQYSQKIVNQSESGYLMLKELTSLKFNRPVKPQQVLVIKGTKDPLVPDKECTKIANIHHTKPILLGDLSHDLMLGEDWRISADIILEWLQSQGLN